MEETNFSGNTTPLQSSQHRLEDRKIWNDQIKAVYLYSNLVILFFSLFKHFPLRCDNAGGFLLNKNREKLLKFRQAKRKLAGCILLCIQKCLYLGLHSPIFKRLAFSRGNIPFLS